jgi:hypothetical protein
MVSECPYIFLFSKDGVFLVFKNIQVPFWVYLERSNSFIFACPFRGSLGNSAILNFSGSIEGGRFEIRET